MDYKQLGNTGLHLSVLGFGAAPLGDEYGAIQTSQSERAVHEAIDRGINLFDTSPYYGRTLSEKRLGDALAGRRDKVILCTKCGRYGKDEFDFSPTRITASIDESLSRLQTDYLDLFIAHDIEFGNADQVVTETIPAMRKIQARGKARFIGISGLPLKLLADVAQRGQVDFVLSYCHYNLLIRDLDVVLAPVAAADGFGLINASPLHMGMLTEAGAPPWHPAPNEVKTVARQVVDLCKKQGIEVATVATRFALNYSKAASTLVGMVNPEQLEQNLKAFDVTIDSELLAEIERLVEPVKNTSWPSGNY